MTGIYLITNKINGKQYIGQAKDINKRIKSHTRGKLHIDKAIAKYGINNFYIDILIECPEDMLDVWERDMIALYGTYNSSRGYNHTEGGDKGPSMYGDKNPMRNINVKEKHKKIVSSISHREKLSISHTGLKRTPRAYKPTGKGKHIFQYDLNMNLIKEWTSAEEISHKYKFDPTYIRRTCKGEFKNAYGFIWRYKNKD